MNNLVRLFKNNKIPVQNVNKLLRELKEGDSCYTVPWAIAINMNRECFLNENYSQEMAPGGTVQMLVRKEEGNYVCDISNCRHNWTPSDYIQSGWDATNVEIVS